jgi:hypothetical protein
MARPVVDRMDLAYVEHPTVPSLDIVITSHGECATTSPPNPLLQHHLTFKPDQLLSVTPSTFACMSKLCKWLAFLRY